MYVKKVSSIERGYIVLYLRVCLFKHLLMEKLFYEHNHRW